MLLSKLSPDDKYKPKNKALMSIKKPSFNEAT